MNSLARERAALVAEARLWIGTPYRHRASIKGVGVDCLGLIAALLRLRQPDAAIAIPPYGPDWPMVASGDILIEGLSHHLKPVLLGNHAEGDVLAFRWRQHLPAMHLAVLAEAGTLIHVHQHAEVCEVPLTSWWQRHCVAAFSFFL
jgi:NlpC/P60 family putative phage cell wall peptidase